MLSDNLLSSLAFKTDSKILLFVLDGLGGLPIEGKTELEAAKTPNLDDLVRHSSLGLMDPISPGITPGSGPAHLALFGYDPLHYEIGRGILEALGLDMELKSGDLACRGNFATVRDEVVVDRRAGRISTEENRILCELLQMKLKAIEGVDLLFRSGIDHRFALRFRGENLSEKITDLDPQREGLPWLPTKPILAKEEKDYPHAERTARIVNELGERVKGILKGYEPANGILLRGFARLPRLQRLQDRTLLTPAAIASYPMYRGLARLVGMDILNTGEKMEDELTILKKNYERFDFFYLHIKKTDQYGEDGDFSSKVRVIENFDKLVPKILNLKPDVLAITGDHSTPALMKSHSWHPSPFLLFSKFARSHSHIRFTEEECARGSLARFPTIHALPLLMANGLKLKRYGA